MKTNLADNPGIAPNTLAWFGLLAVPTLLVLWSAVSSQVLVEALCHEDGPVENTTALCYLVAAFGFLRLSGAGRTGIARWYAFGIAAMCLFVAAEEISWGQRLVGWSTPAAVAAHNVQGETNLHNLTGVVSVVRLVGVLVTLAIFVVLPVAARRSPRLARFALPHPTQAAAATALFAIGLMVLARIVAERPLFELDEWSEFVLALAYLGFGATAFDADTPTPARSGECP